MLRRKLRRALRRWKPTKIGLVRFLYRWKLAGLPGFRHLISRYEIRELEKIYQDSMEKGPQGRAVGALFKEYEPDSSMRTIYREVFSEDRYEKGYFSQCGQDMYLNRWFFKNHENGVFVDVGAYDGKLGSNTWFFEKVLNWRGIAIEPNEAAFAELEKVRSCHTFRGCAYSYDGTIEFVRFDTREGRTQQKQQLKPMSLSDLLTDPEHGGLMLSGIPSRMFTGKRIEGMKASAGLTSTTEEVPCWKLDTLLERTRLDVVDYLSIDVEGAEYDVLMGIDFSATHFNVIGIEVHPQFGNIHELLTDSGFEYLGQLGFDEIFINRDMRFSWERDET